jgi:NNP family nitrate/nitrite transporter-like MFS transporter
MLMWGITLVSLIWMYWSEIVPQRSAGGLGAPAVAAQRV